MHLHILGIAGTFMSALAILAKEAGHEVTGCDAHCYPPVSDLLSQKGISWQEGYDAVSQVLQADCVIVGNAMKRGMPVVEAMLNHRKPYTSGPQWLAEHILPSYRVLAVAGTHGKTTTTSMLAYILEHAGLQPGFLIGGVAPNFGTSARLGTGEYFVIEADEYDSAFFDKRPKLMHYHPHIAILNNLEFDHADIYADLDAIKQQFHYYLRTIPSEGMVLKPKQDDALNAVIQKGLFSRLEDLSITGPADWRAEILEENGQAFRVWHHQDAVAEVHWPLIGYFNIENALAAMAASFHAGVAPQIAAEALSQFQPAKRRLEVKSHSHGITVYDDFAHHPTAITKTIDALKKSKRHQRLFAVLEFASYTMKTGVHADKMINALAGVDATFILNPSQFNLTALASQAATPWYLLVDSQQIVEKVMEIIEPGDAILVMSNRGFDNIHGQLASAIERKYG